MYKTIDGKQDIIYYKIYEDDILIIFDQKKKGKENSETYD